MIRYEVRARVPASLADVYARYLVEEHVPDLLGTGCFVEAEFATEPGEPGEPGAAVRFRSAYLAPDRAHLERYFREHAPRLRTHALERFPDGLSFEREEWELLRRWPAPPA
jgi:hypothetical protein